jgi:excisionase family DNA binding protein
MSEPTGEATPASGEWLTVSQAAALLRVSERTVRRRCEAGKLSARLETTPTGPAWLIEAADIPAASAADAAANNQASAANLRPELDEAADVSAGNSSMPADAADIPADNAIALRVNEMSGEIEQLKSFIAGGIMAQIAARLEQVPSAEQMRDAVEQGIAAAVKNSDGASRDDVVNAVAPVLERLEQIEASNAALRAENEALKAEMDKKSRGFFGRLFGGG